MADNTHYNLTDMRMKGIHHKGIHHKGIQTRCQMDCDNDMRVDAIPVAIHPEHVIEDAVPVPLRPVRKKHVDAIPGLLRPVREKKHVDTNRRNTVRRNSDFTSSG